MFSIKIDSFIKFGSHFAELWPLQNSRKFCPYPIKIYHYLPLYGIIEYVSKNKTCFKFICLLLFTNGINLSETIVSYCPLMKFCHVHKIAEKVIFWFSPKIPTKCKIELQKLVQMFLWGSFFINACWSHTKFKMTRNPRWLPQYYDILDLFFNQLQHFAYFYIL